LLSPSGKSGEGSVQLSGITGSIILFPSVELLSISQHSLAQVQKSQHLQRLRAKHLHLHLFLCLRKLFSCLILINYFSIKKKALGTSQGDKVSRAKDYFYNPLYI
jgi:hypothetical protein